MSVLAACGLVAGGLFVVNAIRGSDGTPDADRSKPIVYPAFAYPDRPWVAELQRRGAPVEFHPSLGWQASDVTSPNLNVHDGVRRSWGSPGAGPVVWFVGGSTMYGLGQRDDHTIASEVARLGAQTGHPIQAVNLGVPGYDQWQESQLVGDRLSRGDRPDLIVFYDGANDLVAMDYRASEGIEPLDEPPNRFHADVEAASSWAPEKRGRPASRPAAIAAFVRMYGAGVDLAERTAHSYGVPTSFYFQPEFASTRSSPHDRALIRQFPYLAPPGFNGYRRFDAAVRAGLPAAVTDLGRALDGATSPLYIDSVHTNERGARLVATAMWATLAPTVASLPPRSNAPS
jgi:hypothetical protein